VARRDGIVTEKKIPRACRAIAFSMGMTLTKCFVGRAPPLKRADTAFVGVGPFPGNDLLIRLRLRMSALGPSLPTKQQVSHP